LEKTKQTQKPDMLILLFFPNFFVFLTRGCGVQRKQSYSEYTCSACTGIHEKWLNPSKQNKVYSKYFIVLDSTKSWFQTKLLTAGISWRREKHAC